MGKEKTPKKEEKPKEAAPAEEEAPAPKKEKDPFAAFPKSSIIFDEFKRVYSNEDIKTKAIPYFWENFDKENFSIWLCRGSELAFRLSDNWQVDYESYDWTRLDSDA